MIIRWCFLFHVVRFSPILRKTFMFPLDLANYYEVRVELISSLCKYPVDKLIKDIFQCWHRWELQRPHWTCGYPWLSPSAICSSAHHTSELENCRSIYQSSALMNMKKSIIMFQAIMPSNKTLLYIHSAFTIAKHSFKMLTFTSICSYKVGTASRLHIART